MAVKDKPKSITDKKIRCIDCEFAKLIRYDKNDPILAECKARNLFTAKQGGTCEYRYAVEVASVPRTCELFVNTKNDKTIELRKKVRSI